MSHSMFGMKERDKNRAHRATESPRSLGGRFDVCRSHKSLLPVYAAPSIPFVSVYSHPVTFSRPICSVFRVHDQIGNKFTFPRARCMDMLRRRQGSEAKNSCPSACFPRLLIGFVCSIKHNSHKMDYDVIGAVDWETKFIERFPRWFPDTTQPNPMSSCTCRVKHCFN